MDHPRITKVIAYSPRAYVHHLAIRSPADLDDELAGWLRESYRVGQQLDVLSGKKAPPREPGDFSWSEPSFPAPARRKSARSHRAIPSRKAESKRPQATWECPKCGRAFVLRNQVHICSHVTLDEALKGKSPLAIALFRKLRAIARRCGPVEIFPQKTRFAFQGKRTFLGMRFLRDAIECEFSLPRRIEHPRFRQILSVSPRAHYHCLRVSSLKEFNRDFRAWLREAYRAGL